MSKKIQNKNKDIYYHLVKDNFNSKVVRDWRTRQSVLISHLEKLINKKNMKVLELGSGRGFLVKELMEQGIPIVGSDFNPINVKLAREMNGVEIIEVDAENISLPSKSFDIVISCELIEHLEDVEFHIRQVKKILKSGGYYCITTPNYYIEALFSFVKGKGFTSEQLHISSQTHSGLAKTLSKLDFDVTFLRMTTLTKSQKEKLGKFANLFPIKYLPTFLQPSIICIANCKK